MNIKTHNIRRLFGLWGVVGLVVHAQEAPQGVTNEEALSTSKALTLRANTQLKANDFTTAEATYRKAIAKSNDNVAAPFNLGNAYYNNKRFSEAFGRYKQAAETAPTKAEKHKAYHNLGNVLMQNKDYPQAVEAYKEALRNNPNDDETRYNLALAQKQQEQQPNQPQNNDKEDEDQEQQQDQNNKDNNPKQDQEDQQKDKSNEGDRGEDNPQDNQNKGEKKPKAPEEKPGEGNPSKATKQQPRPNQLSPQQIENLLEAMQNEEKKVQEKIEAQKVRGNKRNNEKDW